MRPDDPRKEPRELGSQGAKWSVLLDQDHALSEGTVGAWTMAADAGFVTGGRYDCRTRRGARRGVREGFCPIAQTWESLPALKGSWFLL